MMTEDQAATIAFLSEPSTYGLASPVDVIATHISQIFLAGERAFKLKRAVRFPYVDFSTAQLRLAACEKELELNARTAPGLYLGVRSICRGDDGRLAFDSAGEFVDAVVEMVRFDQGCLLDQMAIAGRLEPAHMDQVAGAIADFHRSAPVIHTGGAAAAIRAVIVGNEAAFEDNAVFPQAAVGSLSALLGNALERHAALLDRREAMGKVRYCHGDLHLRNICLLAGRPQLFDCIEFNDAIATVDILYDLAFLLMDLWHRGLPHFANRVANRYLDAMDDDEGFSLLPFFMALRAAIRAHVIATQIERSNARSDELLTDAQSYFHLASALLQPAPSRLIAIGGLSGSGKSTVAELLAPRIGSPPGARILESDRVRKALYQVAPDTKLAPDAYRAEISAKVYEDMNRKARFILGGGGTVIVEAVFANMSDRLSLENMAGDASAHLAAFWLDTDAGVLRGRVQGRESGPSDATLDVLEKQLRQDLGTIDWQRVDAGVAPSAIVTQILRSLTV